MTDQLSVLEALVRDERVRHVVVQFARCSRGGVAVGVQFQGARAGDPDWSLWGFLRETVISDLIAALENWEAAESDGD